MPNATQSQPSKLLDEVRKVGQIPAKADLSSPETGDTSSHSKITKESISFDL
jgi:hypothetical protein